MSPILSCFRSEKQKSYHPVDSESLLSRDASPDSASFHDENEPEKVHRCWIFMCAVLALICLALSATLLASQTERADSLETVWSPLNNDVEHEQKDLTNPFAHETIYRGPPTPELEEAWQDLWLYGGVRIPESKVPLLNRTVNLGNGRTLRPVKDTAGGYHALIEVFHQLHCLNLIRQYTWRDYYPRHTHIVNTPADMLDSKMGSRMHVDHCIEALRLAIMCHGDTTPYMVLDDPSAPGGMRADFSPHHQCRKFDKLQDSMERIQLAKPQARQWRPLD